MDASTEQVERLIHDIRRRWRRRTLVQGAAVTAIVLLLLATGMLLAYVQFDIPPTYQVLALLAGILVVVGTGVQYILRPLMRRITDRQIALYVEEKIPELEDRLNSAVEISDAGRLSYEDSVLIDRLIDDAARKTEDIPLTTVVERGKESLLAYGAAGVLGLFLLIGYLSLDDLRQAVSDVQQLPTTLTQAPIEVRPGNTEVEQGDSQEIIATVRAETAEEVVVHFKRGEGQWQQNTMQKGLNQPAYLHEFQDIQEPIQYTVELGEKRAGPFTLSLYEFPEVQQIDITYNYPSYTGRPVRTEENVGDIRGLKGSAVTVSIATEGNVVEAVIDRENGSDIPLEQVADNRFQAQFALQKKDFYKIRLTDEKDEANKFPQQYRIQPVADEKPYISISDPGRDIRANAVQEVLVAANVQDDYGVRDVQLNYSVNGREEETVALVDTDSLGGQDVTGEYLFFLEEYGLEPGDVISYYVQADDHNKQNSPEVTDMYFIEVLPFDQRFSQVNNAGGAQGGGGSQPSGTVRSQQQIITATWKLYRQKDEMSADEFQSDLKALTQGQANLRQNIEKRLNSTAFSTELQSSEKHQQIAEALRNAVKEMEAAEDQLSDSELKAAISPERKALNHLLKAEAANEERQIALQRGQQSAGGGSAAAEERMSELMDLELDISKDKYEMQQQSAPSQQRQTSEALDRIKELAQKQEQLLKQQELDTRGEDKKRFIDRLEREQQQLQRQAEDLAQQMRRQSRQRGQQSQRMDQQLDQITEQMKEAGRSLRQQDMQKARSQQQQALSELQRMQQKLQMDNTDNLRKQLEDFTQRFDELKEQQEQLGRDIQQTVDDTQDDKGRVDRERLQKLTEQQRTLSNETDQLSEDANRLREQSQSNNPELASKLENLQQRLEQMRLQQQMQESEQALQQGWLDYAQRKQEDIERSMEELSSDMRAFDQELPQTQEEQLTRSLEKVRDLMDQMQDVQQQSRALQQSQNQQAQNQQSQNQQSQNSQGRTQQQSQGQPSQDQQASQRAQAQSKRLQQQLQRAQQSVDELRQELEGNPQAQQQLNQLDSYLKRARADHTGVLLDEDAADSFFNEDIYTPLSELELALARQLDTVEMEKKLYGARRGDVPEEYQQLVEKYYEQLSKSEQ